MIEIALCLAIIGFALVSILLVLPLGMNSQRDTREATIISQDATVLLDAIRGGARGMDDLTNYVYAITNYISFYNDRGVLQNTKPYIWGYAYDAASYRAGTDIPAMHLTNGLRIVGLLSTPEFTLGNVDSGGIAIPTTFGSFYTSNHVVAYVRSFSGLAAEKPPQNNEIMQADTFSYHLLCVNAPVPMDTNNFALKAQWTGQTYNLGEEVLYNWAYWRANANTVAVDVPGQSAKWTKVPFYPLEQVLNQRELRLYFMWPQLPNGNVGRFRQTFRATIDGQLTATNYNNFYPGISTLYFYQPEFFSSAL